MKIAIFIRNGLVGNVVLNHLVPKLIEQGITPILLNTGEPYHLKADHIALNHIGFLETGLLRDVVAPMLEKHPSVSNDNADNIMLSNLQIAQKYRLQLYAINDVNSVQFQNIIKNDPDLIGAISLRITTIFKPDIIKIFKRKGFIWNLHTGILPKYKGVHIPYFAIANKEKEYGWTLHEINNSIDKGAIIEVIKKPLNLQKPVLDTYLSLVENSAQAIVKHLKNFKKNGYVFTDEQTRFIDSYFTYPTAEQMEYFNTIGIRFCDNIAQSYANLFTTAGSQQEKNIKYKINNSIDSYKKNTIGTKKDFIQL